MITPKLYNKDLEDWENWVDFIPAWSTVLHRPVSPVFKSFRNVKLIPTKSVRVNNQYGYLNNRTDVFYPSKSQTAKKLSMAN